MSLALVDYGAGNLTSVKKAFTAIGADLFVPAGPAELDHAGAIVVPGVGHFGRTRALEGAWTRAIRSRIDAGSPLLGICLGMQWLFEGSDEAPEVPGLGLMGGHIVRLGSVRPGGAARNPEESTAPRMLKIPHVGWNSLELRQRVPLVSGVAPDSQVYFTHSYVAPVTGEAVAITDYGEWFTAIAQHGRVCGVQFHPEKSGVVGLTILRNFVELAR